MQVREGGWVWVHARRLTVGQPRRVRAGPDFGKYPEIRSPDPMSRSCARSYAEAVSFTKIDHWSILVKEMRAMGAMLVKMAVLLK